MPMLPDRRGVCAVRARSSERSFDPAVEVEVLVIVSETEVSYGGSEVQASRYEQPGIISFVIVLVVQNCVAVSMSSSCDAPNLLIRLVNIPFIHILTRGGTEKASVDFINPCHAAVAAG